MTKEQLIALLNDMSLEEKVNQMSQVVGGFFADDTVITGPMAEMGFTEENIALSGSVIGSMGAENVKDPESLHGKTSTSYSAVIYAGYHQRIQDGISNPAGSGSNL